MTQIIINESDLKELPKCVFCGTEIEICTESIMCPKCNVPYHFDCWQENNGCAVYGCIGRNDGSTSSATVIDDGKIESDDFGCGCGFVVVVYVLIRFLLDFFGLFPW
ncbi:MAG: hypothetical protein LBG58_07605 [Planctomycetaceae bacterium]|jgi:hypothetical protein|nr:hypothetical protein [Planctomycetaceae bacterium]